MSSLRFGGVAALCALSTACNFTARKTTGGVDLPGRGDCPRGVAVVSSDFQSTEVALLAPGGAVASAAFLSSASSAASGLSAPLSGDVVIAASRSRPGEVISVDRFGTNVLTFVDTRTATVRAQLPVGTGFDANVQDYLEVDEHLAFVPRLGENASPGHEPFDAGSDLLLIDPSVPSISGSLPLPRKKGYLPSPSAALVAGDDVLVTLAHQLPNFHDLAESELVAFALDTRRLHYRLPLTGLKNCGSPALSPDRTRVALACSAYVDRSGAVPDPAASGLVLLDVTQEPPSEVTRFGAEALVGAPLQSSVEFVDDSKLLIKTQTALNGAQDNQLFSVDLESGVATLLATAARDEGGQGYGIALGGMHCASGCGDPCLVADASRGKLLRFDLAAGELERDADISLGGVGLPPVGVTPFW